MRVVVGAAQRCALDDRCHWVRRIKKRSSKRRAALNTKTTAPDCGHDAGYPSVGKVATGRLARSDTDSGAHDEAAKSLKCKKKDANL